MVCHRCGRNISVDRKIGRQETCPDCGSYLHCCLNCRFYDPKAYRACRETEAEWVQDKASANFCSYFEPGDKKKMSGEDRAAEARKKLDELFNK